MKKQIIEMILLKVKAKPQLKKYLFISAGVIAVFGVLVVAVGLWLASLTYGFVSRSVAGIDVAPKVEEVARQLALDGSVDVNNLLDKPLLSQTCMDSAFKLINPSVILTSPLNQLWSDFRLNCINRTGVEEEKEAPVDAGVSV